MAGFNVGGNVTAADAAARYKTNASQAGSQWAKKYLMPRKDPFAAASAAAPYWLQRVNDAGTAAFQAGLQRVDPTAVANLVSTQGPALYAAGINNKGATKYAAAASGLIPALQQAAQNLPPRGTLDQNIARSTAMQRAAAAMRGKYRG